MKTISSPPLRGPDDVCVYCTLDGHVVGVPTYTTMDPHGLGSVHGEFVKKFYDEPPVIPRGGLLRIWRLDRHSLVNLVTVRDVRFEACTLEPGAETVLRCTYVGRVGPLEEPLHREVQDEHSTGIVGLVVRAVGNIARQIRTGRHWRI